MDKDLDVEEIVKVGKEAGFNLVEKATEKDCNCSYTHKGFRRECPYHHVLRLNDELGFGWAIMGRRGSHKKINGRIVIKANGFWTWTSLDNRGHGYTEAGNGARDLKIRIQSARLSLLRSYSGYKIHDW